ncbi:MAG: nucleoside phosphorylase [Muribaculaceae bacterium]|nr:nucleoside phosphorylase [Bacteroides sp.]MDE6222666.1 nucleoside phosphorylase [Muribaculaceae bacterium]MDE6229303.1 nucleoside phosphorylase [Muribaculaceae bacterium]MDE6819065.1 nucleoside phosphorylase [Muribaculaceae bacterium]
MSRIIPPSELIINPDGSVFHLHLLPEQLTDRVILVGDPGRVDMVASFFDTRTFEVSSREFHTIGGTYKGKPIMCLSHGIGPDNIDIVVTELDALANIDFQTREVRENTRSLTLVRIGTSGALQPELTIGTPVIAEKAIGFDGVLNYYAGRNSVADLDFEHALCDHTGWNPLWAKPYVVDADPTLVEQIGRDDMVRGNTISAVGFYGPQGREVRLHLANPDLNARIEAFRHGDRRITNYEMESAPLQGLARLMGHRAMTVCSIIANRYNNTANPQYKNSIADLVRTVLDRI